MKTYNLGGYEQKVLLEGRYSDKPIVLYLHGGPGSPVPFGEGCRGLFPEITRKSIMVYWDQLGCGINDHVIDDSFSIDDYVSMTKDLILSLHNDFPDNKINLFGVSWGSLLAARAAAEMPDIVKRVMVYGHIRRDLFFSDEVINQIDKAKLSHREKQQYQRIKSRSVHDDEDITNMYDLIKKHTDGFCSKSGGKSPLGSLMWGMLTSPDYRLRDFKAAIISNGTKRNQVIARQLIDVDLSDLIKQINIPYYIIQGSEDIVTSTRLIEELLGEIDNPNIRFSILKGSGHMPSRDAMQFIIKEGFAFLEGKA